MSDSSAYIAGVILSGSVGVGRSTHTPRSNTAGGASLCTPGVEYSFLQRLSYVPLYTQLMQSSSRSYGLHLGAALLLDLHREIDKKCVSKVKLARGVLKVESVF